MVFIFFLIFEIQLRFGFHIFFDVWDSASLGFPKQIWFLSFNFVGIWSQFHLHLHLHMSIHFIFIVVSIAIVAIFIFTCIFICRFISSLSLYQSPSSPPLHLSGVGLSPTRIACASSSALVFGMYILFRSVLCTTQLGRSERIRSGNVTGYRRRRHPIFVFVPGWLPADLIFL